MAYPPQIQNLMQKFSELPTIGPKTAERMVLYLLSQNPNSLHELAEAIKGISGKIQRCKECGNFSEQSPCSICSSKTRDKTLLCIVEKPQDVAALEKTRAYNGIYFILGGKLNPIEGKTLDSLPVTDLIQKIKNSGVKEIILALSPDIDGETTILALKRFFSEVPVKITRLARGLPMGSDIEYADEITLADALKGRSIIKS